MHPPKLLLALLILAPVAAQVKLDFVSTAAAYSRVIRLPNGGRFYAGTRQMGDAR
jgi:hypothetical protein